MLRRRSSWVKAFEATTVISLASQRAALTVAGWARKLSSDTTPPGRAKSIAVCRRLGTPAHSMTTSAPMPRVRDWMASVASSGATAVDAPSSMPTRRRISDGSTIRTCPAPAARANCTAKSPIGPAPCTTTVSPGAIRDRRTPWKATVAGSTCAASFVGQVGVRVEDAPRLDGDAAGEATVRRGQRVPAPGDGRDVPAVVPEATPALRADRHTLGGRR